MQIINIQIAIKAIGLVNSSKKSVKSESIGHSPMEIGTFIKKNEELAQR